MSMIALLCCLWVVASAAVAMLPMRLQYAPGLALMIVAPVLIFYLGLAYGPWVAGIAVFGFVSMFRNPLRYFWRRAFNRAGEPQQ